MSNLKASIEERMKSIRANRQLSLDQAWLDRDKLFIEFDPGCIHESAKHLQGVEEYIFLQSGMLEIRVNEDLIKLNERQCFRFNADVPHAYINPSQEACSIVNIIFYSVASLSNKCGI